jgi:hypothetical protein
MQTLLTVIVTWLSMNFGLAAIDEQPRLEFVSEAVMSEVRDGRLASNGGDRIAAEAARLGPAEPGHGVHAIYDDISSTIYLPEGWTATSPADVSVLVHELVHHLQNAAGSAYDCPQARERAAYGAQARWLELFGTSLAEEFEIDPMTVLVRTNCMH